MRTEVKLSPPYSDSFHCHLSCQLESCRSVSQPVTSTLQERQLEAGLNFSLRHDAPQTCELALYTSPSTLTPGSHGSRVGTVMYHPKSFLTEC